MTMLEWFQQPCQCFYRPVSVCLSSACKTCVSEDDSPKIPTCYGLETLMRRNTGKDSNPQGREGTQGTGLIPFLSLSRWQDRFLDSKLHVIMVKKGETGTNGLLWEESNIWLCQHQSQLTGHRSHTLLFSTAKKCVLLCVFLWMIALLCMLQSCLFVTEQKTKATAVFQSQLTA